MAKITIEDDSGVRVFEGILTEMTLSEPLLRENQLTGRGDVAVSMAFQNSQTE